MQTSSAHHHPPPADQRSSAATQLVAPSERILQILACIARHGRPLGVRELVEQTGLPLSTVYRHLTVLKNWGWVQEHARSGLYEPGPLAVPLAHGFDQQSWLMQIARPEIEQLAERSSESVGLLCYLHGQVVCLDMVESLGQIPSSFAKGRVNTTIRGASAKALLAFLPAALQAQVLDQYLASDDVQRASLQAELQQIRSSRYATSQNEVDQGIWGVSAPIFSSPGKLIATLSLMSSSGRVAVMQQEFINMTLSTADRISRRLQE